ncbi:MAG: S24/S26 family peptidase [Bacteroidales bacterium]
MDKYAPPKDVLLPEVARLLQEGEIVMLKVKGKSMLPFIKDGTDCIVLRKCDGEPRVGDIVFAKVDGGQYLFHRVIGLDGDSVELMGDGNWRGTEHCGLSGILGYVTSIRRGERIIDCTCARERRKAAAWRRLLPVRRYLLWIYRRFE